MSSLSYSVEQTQGSHRSKTSHPLKSSEEFFSSSYKKPIDSFSLSRQNKAPKNVSQTLDFPNSGFEANINQKPPQKNFLATGDLRNSQYPKGKKSGRSKPLKISISSITSLTSEADRCIIPPKNSYGFIRERDRYKTGDFHTRNHPSSSKTNNFSKSNNLSNNAYRTSQGHSKSFYDEVEQSSNMWNHTKIASQFNSSKNNEFLSTFTTSQTTSYKVTQKNNQNTTYNLRKTNVPYIQQIEHQKQAKYNHTKVFTSKGTEAFLEDTKENSNTDKYTVKPTGSWFKEEHSNLNSRKDESSDAWEAFSRTSHLRFQRNHKNYKETKPSISNKWKKITEPVKECFQDSTYSADFSNLEVNNHTGATDSINSKSLQKSSDLEVYKNSCNWDKPVSVIGSWLCESGSNDSKNSSSLCSWETVGTEIDPWLEGPQLHDSNIKIIERMPWHYSSVEKHFKRQIYEHNWETPFEFDPDDKTVIDGRWKIIKKIGQGGFGAVFYARNIQEENASRVAIKREYTMKCSLLEKEVKIYQLFQNLPNIPSLHFHGWVDKQYVIAVDLLGPTLRKLIDSSLRCKLSIVLEIGIQMIDVLQALHSKKIIYRDVKPENFLLGSDSASYIDNTTTVKINDMSIKHLFSLESCDNSKDTPFFHDVPISSKEKYVPKLFLVDFGLSKVASDQTKLRNFKTGTKHRRLSGTAVYASLAYHKGLGFYTCFLFFTQSILYPVAGPLDDLESVGYILIELLNKKLPWSNLNFGRLKGTNQRWSNIAKSKQSTSLPFLCSHLPQQFVTFFQYVRNSLRNTTPDYDFLRGLFR